MRTNQDNFDLAVIQGIPGFYHKFGYHYAIPMENHINLSLYQIIDNQVNSNYVFSLAEYSDIPFLNQEDEEFRKKHSLSSVKNEEKWKYLLGEGKQTEYAAEFWIVKNSSTKETTYFKIMLFGFGTGLIISEIGETASYDDIIEILLFCKKKAIERQKPYIRLNISNLSDTAKIAFSMGAQKSLPYAWQIKVPEKIDFLQKILPLLNRRIENSVFRNWTGVFRLYFYTDGIDLKIEQGKICEIKKADSVDCPFTLCVPPDLFAPLVLGHRT
jgi:hypothetical protein